MFAWSCLTSLTQLRAGWLEPGAGLRLEPALRPWAAPPGTSSNAGLPLVPGLPILAPDWLAARVGGGRSATGDPHQATTLGMN